MNLKQLARSVKNYIKMSAKGEAFVELFDVNDNSVVFEVPTIDDIQVGTSASPDGEFLFTDGTKIVIDGGVVTVMEKPTDGEQPLGEGEPVVEPEKDARIAELEAANAQLMDEIATLKSDLEGKVEEITDVEKELSEIQNFYIKMNRAQLKERSTKHKDDEGMAFSFKKKSKI